MGGRRARPWPRVCRDLEGEGEEEERGQGEEQEHGEGRRGEGRD